MKNFKIKLIKQDIPYLEFTRDWQQLVDIHTAANSDGEIWLEDLCNFHNLPAEYYGDLKKLILDGLIEVNP